MATAVVFSNVNILSLHLVEFLLTSHCQVYVVSEDVDEWKNELKHLSQNPNLKIFEDRRFLPPYINYIFCISGIGLDPTKEYVREKIKGLFEEVIEETTTKNAKTLFFLPYVLPNSHAEVVVEEYEYLKSRLPEKCWTVYLGELYGSRMQFLSGGLLTQTIRDAVFGSVVMLPARDTDIYFLYVEDAVRETVQKLFSFGFEEREIALTNRESIYKFFSDIQQLKPSLSFLKDEAVEVPRVMNIKNVSTTSEQKKDSLKKTIAWLAQYAPVPDVLTSERYKEKVEKEATPKPYTPKKKHQVNKGKLFLAGSLLLLFILLVSPFVSLFVSAALLKYSYETLLNGDFVRAEKSLNFASVAGGYSKNSLGALSSTPLVGGLFVFPRDVSNILLISEEIGKDGISVARNSTDLLQNVLGDEDYDVDSVSRELSQKFDSLYTQMSFLDAELDNLPSVKQLVPKEVDFKKYRTYVLTARDLSLRLPDILGSDTPKTYLVLLQNNMELRPTGGFIGSFALVTFEVGKLTNINVMDVYEADGQLKGHVEPPTPIKNYLGEANWYLRDSNWDPDFEVSGQRAEWFLGKELDRGVDGVIGVDLELAKKVIAQTGPLKLVDFQDEVDHRNLYEKVQYQVEADFFPGSQKKANFLTSLTSSLLDRLTHAEKREFVKLGKAISESLDGRHLQIYMHDSIARVALDNVNWNGEIELPNCSGNCEALLVGMVEANVGVNKANYFIERQAKLSAVIEGGKVKNRLTVDLKNNATPALGLSGKYKGYVRVFTNPKSRFSPIEISGAGERKIVEPEFVENNTSSEAGTLVEVFPGQTRTVTFTWEKDTRVSFTNPGTFKLLWRKQAGTVNDPVQIDINLAGLTQGGAFSYNTSLSEDFSTEVNW